MPQLQHYWPAKLYTLPNITFNNSSLDKQGRRSTSALTHTELGRPMTQMQIAEQWAPHMCQTRPHCPPRLPGPVQNNIRQLSATDHPHNEAHPTQSAGLPCAY